MKKLLPLKSIFILLIFLSIDSLFSEKCQRDIPEATLRSDFPLKITSKYSKSKNTFLETFTFNSQQMIVIENKGCESYWIEYFFKFPINGKINSYSEIIKSLSLINKYNESGINISMIIKILKNSEEKNIINKDIKISDNEFGEYFRLEKKTEKSKIIYSLSAIIGL
ncbi:hypothetical protein AB3N62_10960 [Leptospira sp. WS4.C2]